MGEEEYEAFVVVYEQGKNDGAVAWVRKEGRAHFGYMGLTAQWSEDEQCVVIFSEKELGRIKVEDGGVVLPKDDRFQFTAFRSRHQASSMLQSIIYMTDNPIS